MAYVEKNEPLDSRILATTEYALWLATETGRLDPEDDDACEELAGRLMRDDAFNVYLATRIHRYDDLWEALSDVIDEALLDFMDGREA